jgi:hypothetical protein
MLKMRGGREHHDRLARELQAEKIMIEAGMDQGTGHHGRALLGLIVGIVGS